MKIVFVTSSLRGGGITSYAHEVIDCFAAQHDMTVIVGDDSKNPFDRNKVKIMYCESSNTSVGNAQRLLHIINEEVAPDVVINSNSVLMTLITPFVSDSIRIISVSHSLRYNEADNAGFNSQFNDSIIALSTYNEAYLRNRYSIKEAGKVKIVYNFVDELPDATEIREKKKARRPVRIIFSGGTSATKSPELVFDIMQRLLKTDREFEFVFMGAHSPTMQRFQPYKSLQQLLKPDARVRFTGRVSRQEAEELISSANVLLIPSRREGCPMAMLEAMRVGCVVITSDYKNACREMVEDGRSGFVISHKDKDAFVSRILDVIDHHEQYYSFYDECYRDFIERFSFPHWREAMGGLINEKSTSHLPRMGLFSERLFLQMEKQLKRQYRKNAIHMVFHERLKSAIPFFLKYLKSKVNL